MKAKDQMYSICVSFYLWIAHYDTLHLSSDHYPFIELLQFAINSYFPLILVFFSHFLFFPFPW